MLLPPVSHMMLCRISKDRTQRGDSGELALLLSSLLLLIIDAPSALCPSAWLGG